ncbi:hypothetical protein DFJ74DRAFT_187660 [Hyaloraphidium curvatum]|nr:hypothetical protein DFJ74DRAFT_187660 [Hyaloraphidium curvatum]
MTVPNEGSRAAQGPLAHRKRTATAPSPAGAAGRPAHTGRGPGEGSRRVPGATMSTHQVRPEKSEDRARKPRDHARVRRSVPLQEVVDAHPPVALDPPMAPVVDPLCRRCDDLLDGAPESGAVDPLLRLALLLPARLLRGLRGGGGGVEPGREREGPRAGMLGAIVRFVPVAAALAAGGVAQRELAGVDGDALLGEVEHHAVARAHRARQRDGRRVCAGVAAAGGARAEHDGDVRLLGRRVADLAQLVGLCGVVEHGSDGGAHQPRVDAVVRGVEEVAARAQHAHGVVRLERREADCARRGGRGGGRLGAAAAGGGQRGVRRHRREEDVQRGLRDALRARRAALQLLGRRVVRLLLDGVVAHEHAEVAGRVGRVRARRGVGGHRRHGSRGRGRMRRGGRGRGPPMPAVNGALKEVASVAERGRGGRVAGGGALCDWAP